MENATFQFWMQDFHTRRFLQALVLTQCFFAVMALLWLAETMVMDNAAFHLWTPVLYNYTQVSAGEKHTVLLRSDGCAVACGINNVGQCDISQLGPGKSYISDLRSSEHLVLQAVLSFKDDAVSVLCSTLSGNEMLRMNVGGSDLAWDIHKGIARELSVNLQNLQVVLPNGRLLAGVCFANPETTIADVANESQHAKRRRCA